MTDHSLLIGDIGGTNARFALANEEEPAFSDELTLACSDFETAEAAIKHYLSTTGAGAPTAICLAAAGPIVDEQVRFTNNPWIIAVGDLQQEFGTNRVQLLNDFEAIAYSVPLLGEKDTMPIGLPTSKPLRGDRYTVAVTGPGTGLGAVGLQKDGEHLMPIIGESSHGGFAPESKIQTDLLTQLRERFERVSTERLVSGPGLENLYWALCRIHKEKRAPRSAAEIFSASIEDGEPRATEAVDIFFEILGQFAGDLALTISAYEGIYIAGGIAKRYPERLANSRFRTGFENKGRYRSLMERTPTQLITHDQPGLVGAAYCAARMLT